MSWFSWNEPYNRSPRREPSEVVVDTLMLELSWQMKEAERLQRERDNEYRRLKSGVDYSWLMSAPRTSYDISQGEKLGLEDLCSKVPPTYCGPAIQRWDRWVERSILHLLFSTWGCSSLQVQERLIWVISLLSRLCDVSTRKCTETAMLFSIGELSIALTCWSDNCKSHTGLTGYTPWQIQISPNWRCSFLFGWQQHIKQYIFCLAPFTYKQHPELKILSSFPLSLQTFMTFFLLWNIRYFENFIFFVHTMEVHCKL